MIFRTVLTTIFLTLCLGMDAQANESPKQASIFALQPFERAICCIKYYEGIHRKKDYPYVGYGHKLRPGEHYSSNMSLREAGKDSLLLAALAYNVGPYRILGNRTKYPKSILLKKIETGNRDFKDDYVQFCHWKGKKIPSIERRRYAELMLLYME